MFVDKQTGTVLEWRQAFSSRRFIFGKHKTKEPITQVIGSFVG